MRRKDAYQNVLDRFRCGKINILLGTQMIAKGLDFPNVTLVGVLNADIQLHAPDFRSSERTYQLLTQVSGRAGRGDVSGKVLIQTYTPHHPAIRAVQKMNDSVYLDEDLSFRKQLNYPPFAHLVVITMKGLDELEVRNQLDVFIRDLSAFPARNCYSFAFNAGTLCSFERLLPISGDVEMFTCCKNNKANKALIR